MGGVKKDLGEKTGIKGEIWEKVGCGIWEEWVRWASKKKNLELRLVHGLLGVAAVLVEPVLGRRAH